MLLIAAILAAGCSTASTGRGGGSATDSSGFGFAKDTAPPTDSGGVPAAEDIPRPPEDTGACALGGPCSDGDACTINDQCVAGAGGAPTCQGQPTDCDDGVVCTTDSCAGGICSSVVAPGFCLIEGVCWAAGDTDPKNGCQQCGASATGWTTVAGACDDGDPCTADLCVGGVCVGEPIVCPDDQNPCTSESCVAGACQTQPSAGPCDDGSPCTTGDQCANSVCVSGSPVVCPDDGDPCTTEACGAAGCTSQPIPGCEVDECQYHNECNPAGVCAEWKSTGKTKCSAPCAGPADCGANSTCTKLPGSANIGFCEAMVPGGFGVGTQCDDDSGCASGTCEGVCVATCMDQGACPPGQTCTLADNTAVGELSAVCFPDAAAFVPNGQPCSPDGQAFGSGVCQSGHCDLLGAPPWLCAPPCTSEADCLPAQECNIVLYSPSPNPKTKPFSATIGGLRHDVFMGCYAQPSPGFKADGSLCSGDSECVSGKCQQLDLATPSKYCTSFCTSDAECPPTLKCKLDALALTSNWLISGELQTQGQQLQATTFVRVCRLP